MEGFGNISYVSSTSSTSSILDETNSNNTDANENNITNTINIINATTENTAYTENTACNVTYSTDYSVNTKENTQENIQETKFYNLNDTTKSQIAFKLILDSASHNGLFLLDSLLEERKSDKKSQNIAGNISAGKILKDIFLKYPKNPIANYNMGFYAFLTSNILNIHSNLHDANYFLNRVLLFASEFQSDNSMANLLKSTYYLLATINRIATNRILDSKQKEDTEQKIIEHSEKVIGYYRRAIDIDRGFLPCINDLAIAMYNVDSERSERIFSSIPLDVNIFFGGNSESKKLNRDLILYNQSILYVKQKSYQNALKVAKKIEYVTTQIHHLMANIYYHTGDLVPAKKHLQAILNISNHDVIALHNLIIILKMQDDSYELHQKIYQEIYKEETNKPSNKPSEPSKWDSSYVKFVNYIGNVSSSITNNTIILVSNSNHNMPVSFIDFDTDFDFKTKTSHGNITDTQITNTSQNTSQSTLHSADMQDKLSILKHYAKKVSPENTGYVMQKLKQINKNLTRNLTRNLIWQNDKKIDEKISNIPKSKLENNASDSTDITNLESNSLEKDSELTSNTYLISM